MNFHLFSFMKLISLHIKEKMHEEHGVNLIRHKMYYKDSVLTSTDD